MFYGSLSRSGRIFSPESCARKNLHLSPDKESKAYAAIASRTPPKRHHILTLALGVSYVIIGIVAEILST
jgi:hypothetical protein